MSDQTEGMTDEELATELQRLETIRELRRREAEREQRRAEIIAQVDALLLELQQLDGVEAGTEWQRPISAAGAYPLGAVVTWDGETWENLVPSNPYEPGVSGWGLVAQIDPETGVKVPPRFVQPAGSHDAYQEGQRITWEDEVYAAVRDGVVHDPGEAPQEWEPDEDEPEPDPEDGSSEPDQDDEPQQPDAPDTPEWEVGVSYEIGDQINHQGVTYRLIQNHTSAAHWPPDQVASIYEVI